MRGLAMAVSTSKFAREPGAVLAPDTLLYWHAPSLDPAEFEIAVTIPTFRRPEMLTATLASIAPQLTGAKALCVVMENDAGEREGAKAASAFFEANGIDGLVVIAVPPGNCNAYNCGWRTVLDHFPAVRFIAVADDDERAAPDWLACLLAAQKANGADCVGGPQKPQLPEGMAETIAHPVFRPAYSKSGVVPILYSSGNLLVGRHVLEQMPFPFLDPLFNFTGGGDSDFFARARTKGFRFAWANDAVLHEIVPARRMEKDWLRARSLRNGALSAIIERRGRPGAFGRLAVLAKSLALLGASPIRALFDLARTGSLVEARYRMDIGLGRMMGELGWINEQYRTPEKN
jgi:glycosyltransferase involved in cell wall biosynthesis